MRCAVILAGGQSRRFQIGDSSWTDKALAVLFGKPLLVHIVEKVSPVVDEIIICVNDFTRKFNYIKVLKNYSITNVKICVDANFPNIRGPSVAIATGLKKSSADRCMILPCDTPFIKPSVIDYLLKLVVDFDVCVPIHPDGNIEPLMFSCNRERVARVSEILCLLGRSRPVDIMRASSRIKFVSTVGELREFDPDFRCFININFKSDLVNFPTRVPKEGPVTRSIDLDLAQPSIQEIDLIGNIARRYSTGEHLNIINSLLETSRIFEEKGFHFWTGVIFETMGKIFHILALNKKGSMEVKEYCISGEMAFKKAALKYAMEASIYGSRQIKFLLESANKDKLWCLCRGDEMAALCSSMGTPLL